MTYRNWRTWSPSSVQLRDGRGPERVTTEDPPTDWRPPAPVGFVTPVVRRDRDVEPLVWEGDQA